MSLRHLRPLVIAIAFAVAALALPAVGAAGVAVQTDRGVVQSVAPGQITVRALDGTVVAYSVSASTLVKLNGVVVAISDLKPGFIATVVHDAKLRAKVIRAFGTPVVVTDRGTVTALLKGSITIRTADGRVLTVALDPATTVPGPRPPRQAGSRQTRSVRRRQARGRRAGTGRQRAQARGSVSGSGMRGGTILLVEDEEDIATLVRTYLENDGFTVIWASRGVEGLLALEQSDIRLAILDLQLPDADGLDLCRAIRDHSQLPIVIVTARDEEIDRITGLELGADDYITKPFSPRELVARVRAVLRRAEPENGADLVTAGDIVLEHGGRNVSVAGSPVDLTGMEFDLLAFLLAHPGTVWSRERLLERVWGLSFPGGTRTVDVHVAQLRKKLDRPDLIRTVRGSGYKAVT